MNIPSKKRVYSLATELVVEGKILRDKLSKLKLDERWLEKELKKAGIKDIEEVFYAEVQEDGSLFISK